MSFNSHDKKVPPPLPDETAYVLVSLWKRGLAFVVDTFVITILLVLFHNVVMIPRYYEGGLAQFEHDGMLFLQEYQTLLSEDRGIDEMVIKPSVEDAMKYLTLVLFLGFILYFSLMELILDNSSLGKKIFKIKSLNKITKSPPHPLQAIVRSIFKSLAMLSGAFFIVDIIIAFFTRNRQTIHDLMSGTIIVEEGGQEGFRHDGED
jgi:uncharacterized RDD family membrane protein YckC